MPELPEVETVRRGLAPVMEGARFVEVVANRGDLRWPLPKDFAKRLKGQTVSGLGRRAKYLLADLSSGDVLVMHLGMSGSFRVEQDSGVVTPGAYYHDRSKDLAHDHVVFRMSSGATIRFNDPRRFGSMKLVPRTKLDEEPLLRAISAPSRSATNSTPRCWRRRAGARTRASRPRCSIRRVVAGLGNIYVCEAFSRALLSPKRKASTIANRNGTPNDRAVRLIDAIKTVLHEAIEAGGSSLRDHRRTDGELGMFQHNFRVYDREGKPCPTRGCKGTIKRIVQNGRSTFFCPVCQK